MHRTRRSTGPGRPVSAERSARRRWRDIVSADVTIVEYFVMRWSMEVTFQEARTHLGMETLRNWKDQAIARATPTLLALFSMVTLMTLRLCPEGNIPVQETAWYKKAEPTFSDVIALVRRRLWQARFYVNSTESAELSYFSQEMLELFALYHLPLVA